ncbi:hypothetical protein [Sebaldella sp. S0638]|uniref:hypothetical protein n=1 Tax=Sebaldella sp. S0638 TaxID=2957809 RepID=UPI00209F0CE5|nr:hypothetical protein [Sebaldella sp. S0638]MCP1223311.1 hypothetical protein [Sebaldella sp. S0638]
MKNRVFKTAVLIFILSGTAVFSNIINEKLDSSRMVLTFPFVLMARPFVMSSGTEYEILGSLLENEDIKSALAAQGVKETDKLTADETEYGVFISKNNKILLFVTSDEENLKIFGKMKREK